jgi:predicted RNase H-like HicB family nuclease
VRSGGPIAVPPILAYNETITGVEKEVVAMLTQYIDAAMRRAHYEILTDDGSVYGEISECQGVYANAGTLEECRAELGEVLEDWLLFRIHKNLSLPTIDGLQLKVEKEVAV